MSTPAFQDLAHAFGWTLLHFCWQGSLIGILLACILSLSRNGSPKMRYLACCLALLIMAAMPVLTYTRLVIASHSHAATVTLSITRSHGPTIDGAANLSEPLLSGLQRGFDHSVPMILTMWAAGVVLISCRLGVGLAVAHRMKARGTAPVPHAIQTIFDHLLRRLSITPHVKLLTSVLVQGPTLIGWVRPVVLLPLSCLSGLSSTQLEALLVHELAHVRRHDYLINVLQALIEALLFYHPAIWWVSRSIRRERENCCDDVAVGITGDALSYARALSFLEEQRLNVPQPILEATGVVLVMRIKRIIGVDQARAHSHLAALIVLTLSISGIAGGIATFARAQNKLVAQETTAGDGVPTFRTEYHKWLDEDVRWNITPAERTAFLHLSSDAERDKFIEQFWVRRDAAGAPLNSSRREHYNRIAYANQHFAAARPGWETDRGRIYILYGPPTSVDSHPVSGSSDEPYEVWEYDNALELGQRIELKFVDTCRCGDYQLSGQPEANATSPDHPDKALDEKGVAQWTRVNTRSHGSLCRH